MSKGRKWTEAFYGGSIPESRSLIAEHDIVSLAMTIRSDLSKSFSDMTDDEANLGIESVLRMMRQLGASHPNVYKEQEALAIKAFQHGLSKVREMRALSEAQAERERRDVEFHQGIAERSPVRDAVMNKFEGYRSEIISDGVTEDISLMAWKALVDRDLDALLDMGGYAFFLINWQIPQKENIYDHDDVIRICNEHPRLINRGKTRMKVNSKAWRGKYTD